MASASSNDGPVIVVADDDVHFLRLMDHHLRTWGFRVEQAADKAALYRALAEQKPSLVLLDVRLGEHDGVELLAQLLDRTPTLQVIMLTAHGSIDGAVSAIRIGARDYITKPVDLERLRQTINHVLDSKPTASVGRNRAEIAPATPSDRGFQRPILGQSAATVALIEQIKIIAHTDATVMILGESGSGKELVARAIHELSARNKGPFVAINVAALPRELVESTLFGHEKGAFTGADRAQIGCCQAADQGTLFLDEIAEMELGLQAKLLRFLQERTIQRVGRNEPIPVDVRIVAATNREPLDLVRQGRFREDLYYRLNVVPLRVPTLRARRSDIPLLAEHFLTKALERYRKPMKSFSTEALAALERYDWPGNVRQLENVIERLAILVPGTEIGLDALRSHLGEVEFTAAVPTEIRPERGGVEGAPFSEGEPLSEFERIEKQAIVDSLNQTGGSVREAAKRLGIGQATIYRKLKKYNIDL